MHIRAVGPWTRNLRKTYDPNNLKSDAETGPVVLPKVGQYIAQTTKTATVTINAIEVEFILVFLLLTSDMICFVSILIEMVNFGLLFLFCSYV